jgi:heme exporter protein B
MLAILRKDLALELRTKEGVSSLFVLGLLVLLIFQFAMPERPTPHTAAAALWLAFVLAGTLGVQRTFLIERDALCLYGLLTAPIDPSAIYVAKALGNVILLTLLQLFVVPLIAVFFGVSPPVEVASWAGFALVLLLGNVGFSASAALFAAISVRTRAREVMLPVLLFPLLAPVMIAAVQSTARLLAGDPIADVAPWIQVLVAFDAIFGAAGWILFEQVVRE